MIRAKSCTTGTAALLCLWKEGVKHRKQNILISDDRYKHASNNGAHPLNCFAVYNIKMILVPAGRGHNRCSDNFLNRLKMLKGPQTTSVFRKRFCDLLSPTPPPFFIKELQFINRVLQICLAEWNRSHRH